MFEAVNSPDGGMKHWQDWKANSIKKLVRAKPKTKKVKSRARPKFKPYHFYVGPCTHRDDPRVQEWRRLVLARDHNKCVRCGSGGSLVVHHKLMWARYPRDRLEVRNGETLCVKCHSKKHPWLYIDDGVLGNQHMAAIAKECRETRGK